MSRVQDQVRRQRLRMPPTTAPRTRFNGSVTPHRVIEGRSQQSEEVADLLELAARVGVEVAVAGQQVEILEQRDRHPGGNLGIGARVVLHATTLARITHHDVERDQAVRGGSGRTPETQRGAW